MIIINIYFFLSSILCTLFSSDCSVWYSRLLLSVSSVHIIPYESPKERPAPAKKLVSLAKNPGPELLAVPLKARLPDKRTPLPAALPRAAGKLRPSILVELDENPDLSSTTCTEPKSPHSVYLNANDLKSTALNIP